jgi:hypothetical protein
LKAADTSSRIDALTAGAMVYVVAYCVYLLLLFALLKIVDFDLVFGWVRLCRTKYKKGTASITSLVTVMIIFVFLVPLGVGLAWAIHVGVSELVDWSTGCCIFLGVVFATSSIVGFANWYSNNWALERLTQVLFYTAMIAVMAFGVLITVVPKNYSFTGVTAIFMVLNFAPACALVYFKSSWDDIDLKLLYKEISQQILLGTFDLSVLEVNDEAAQAMEEKCLDEIDKSIKSHYKRNQCFKSCSAITFYALTLVAYVVIVGAQEADGMKATGFVLSLWITATDLIILSLNSAWAEVQTESPGIARIYSPQFQSSFMLFCRIILCYSREDWLMMMGGVLVMVSFVVALNTSMMQARKAGYNSSFFEDMKKIYQMSPLLQAHV